MTTTQPLILKVNAVTKTFPGVVALNKMSFDPRPGEVHTLVGENAAGKSTLTQVLAGLYKDKPVQIASPLVRGSRASC